MSEVIIELDLKRRSGVLAGAVAALRHLALDFKSQQLIDHEGKPRLILTTAGRVADLAQVSEVYAQARGVSGLADVRVDGVSLMHLPPEPEPEPEPLADIEPELDAGTIGMASGDPESVDPGPIFSPPPESEPSAAAAEHVFASSEGGDDDFSDEAFARHALASSDPGPAPAEAAKPEPEERPSLRPGTRTVENEGGLKPSMVRRRRRRR